MQNRESNVNQTNNSSLTLQVTNDLTVQIFTNPEFDFLMDTKEVALGYGVTPQTIRTHKSRYQTEIVENQHFVYGVEILNSLRSF